MSGPRPQRVRLCAETAARGSRRQPQRAKRGLTLGAQGRLFAAQERGRVSHDLVPVLLRIPVGHFFIFLNAVRTHAVVVEDFPIELFAVPLQRFLLRLCDLRDR